ncbi:glycosyltransferase [Ileibacterium valens]|uniref:Glycosyltransferase 2-like domain-containing protein n=1 Tax=Ileibacterium valens TaxID=1862668 RepID=A0A1U7NIH7_9FIRM|nr:glycosyltransferase [Ileibacterium valens]OLU39769.1 hypothetical protein BM735_06855 [Erysipelotrichaceae bacterium NYU-BL-F16]OLU42012.1 hypothetical protein BO224_02600 [Erysipelotrichaceae bacterium NYU-BL-E8]OLU42335.1 hypothetical protein BO222_01800 [Ileibacterium valens]
MISVVLPCYRESIDLLEQSIDSILNQSYKDFELIVILDDPKNSQIVNFMDKKKLMDSRIRFFQNEVNLGVNSTLRKGFSNAKGEIFARMDADDISLRDRFKKQLSWMKDHELDLCGTQTEVIDDNGKIMYSAAMIPTKSQKVKKALRYGQVLAHPSWMMKRELYEKLNGYRDIPTAEDYDFTLRAVLSGAKAGNVPEVLFQYRMSTGSVSRSSLYDQYLTMKILSDSYRNNKVVDPDKIKKQVLADTNIEESEKYTIANRKFNNGLTLLKNRNLIKAFSSLVQVPFISMAYMDKVYRLIRISMLKN